MTFVRYKMLKLTKTSHISRPGPIARSLYQIIGLSSNISPPFSPTRSSSSSCTARVRPLLRRGILPLETASAIPRTLRSTRFFVGAGAQQQPTTPIARSAATTIGSHVSTCELLTTLPDALATISAVSWMYGWSCCWPSSIICSAATNFETLPFIAARARLLSVGGGGDGGGGGAGGGVQPVDDTLRDAPALRPLAQLRRPVVGVAHEKGLARRRVVRTCEHE